MFDLCTTDTLSTMLINNPFITTLKCIDVDLVASRDLLSTRFYKKENYIREVYNAWVNIWVIESAGNYCHISTSLQQISS